MLMCKIKIIERFRWLTTTTIRPFNKSVISSCRSLYFRRFRKSVYSLTTTNNPLFRAEPWPFDFKFNRARAMVSIRIIIHVVSDRAKTVAISVYTNKPDQVMKGSSFAAPIGFGLKTDAEN